MNNTECTQQDLYCRAHARQIALAAKRFIGYIKGNLVKPALSVSIQWVVCHVGTKLLGVEVVTMVHRRPASNINSTKLSYNLTGLCSAVCKALDQHTAAGQKHSAAVGAVLEKNTRCLLLTTAC